MKMKVCKTDEITHEEWLDFRRGGIGGSDAATIVGLNPYGSLYALYHDKLGFLPPKEDNEAMRQGRDLEQYVADRWMEATGKRCRKNNTMWRSVEHPFMLADIDRDVVGENAGLECKTTSVYNRADLEKGEIPLNYYAQCLHYISVMGYDRMYLAVLVLNKGFYHFCIQPDEKETEILIEQEREFWEKHILPNIPPDIDGSEATAETIRTLYPEELAGAEAVPLSAHSRADLMAFLDLKMDIKNLQEACDAARGRVMAEMGTAPVGDAGDWVISWKSQGKTTFDVKLLKSRYPEIYAEFFRTTTTRAFRVIKKKEEKHD